jgi:hypothetical protein
MNAPHAREAERLVSAHMLLIDKDSRRIIKTYGPTDSDIVRAVRDGRKHEGKYFLMYSDGRPVDLEASGGYPGVPPR